jgi:hypothetical protein
MYCSLLKTIKLFTLLTTMFSAETSLYLDRSRQPVAIQQSIQYHRLPISSQSVTVFKPAYYDCLLHLHKNHTVSVITPRVGMEVTSKNIPGVIRLPTLKPRAKGKAKTKQSPAHRRPEKSTHETDSDSSSDDELSRQWLYPIPIYSLIGLFSLMAVIVII